MIHHLVGSAGRPATRHPRWRGFQERSGRGTATSRQLVRSIHPLPSSSSVLEASDGRPGHVTWCPALVLAWCSPGAPRWVRGRTASPSPSPGAPPLPGLVLAWCLPCAFRPDRTTKMATNDGLASAPAPLPSHLVFVESRMRPVLCSETRRRKVKRGRRRWRRRGRSRTQQPHRPLVCETFPLYCFFLVPSMSSSDLSSSSSHTHTHASSA